MNFDLDIETEEQLQAIQLLVSTGRKVLEDALLLEEEMVAPLTMSLRLAKRHFNGEAAAATAEKESRASVDVLKGSRFFEFWSTLVPNQVVRWKTHPNAEYEVVTGDLLKSSEIESGWKPTHMRAGGFFVELRRTSGKTFWCHVSQVRPLNWTS